MHVFVEPDTIVSETETRNLSLLRLADLTGLLELRAESCIFSAWEDKRFRCSDSF